MFVLIAASEHFHFQFEMDGTQKHRSPLHTHSASIQCQVNGKTISSSVLLPSWQNVWWTFYAAVFHINDQTNICKWTNSLYQKLKSNWLHNKDSLWRYTVYFIRIFGTCVLCVSSAFHWVRQANNHQWAWFSECEHKLRSAWYVKYAMKAAFT